MSLPHLHNCCHYVSLATGTWIIGWWNIIYCFLVLLVNGIFLSNLNVEEEGERVHAIHMLVMTMVVSTIQLAFTGLLLVGTYKGHRTLIFCWTVATAVLTLISIILYSMMMSSMFYKEELLFAILSVANIYCILVVISYYRDVNTTC
ncbi:uncharacterized protein LOC128986078 [Macrosteles quadrilineatus]|uniref:uncharacterized protein LOC128986078 n=1 Tax=Macrosteles quadrilineatus TaxID=74068 RepID=UPI0023E2B6D8|nr:uncharacterized protein LOC128986078 [Macrosteles quadrilineatus]XP_054262163.1 uncharacterized protein LOC128986078 [Macrosteles quadrilineatus]